jgi:hypothetical protein
MFQFIKTQEDARNLYDIFVKVMEVYKDKGLSDQELFNIIEYQYYFKYIMDDEVNARYDEVQGNDDHYGEFVECCYNGYDGNDGYDN